MVLRFPIGPVSAIVLLSQFLVFPVSAETTMRYSPGDSFTFDPSLGNSSQDFGVVHVESDNNTGWTLRVRSQAHGKMYDSHGEASIRYELEVDGHTINNLSSGNDVTALFTSRLTCPPPGGCDYAVRGRIWVTEIDGKPAGRYSDRLIFTLTNN